MGKYAFVGGILVDGQRRVDQRFERRREVRIGDFVAGPASLRLSDDDATIAQAGQVVRDVRAGEIQALREHGRVARTVQ